MFFKYDWQLIYGKKLSFHKHFFLCVPHKLSVFEDP